MAAIKDFLDMCDPHERSFLDAMNTPRKVQDFLEAVAYPSGEENRSPLDVLRQKKAHCLDGGLFAVLALRMHGHPPLIIDLLPEPGRDDDHVLALYRVNDAWGAVAKSNYSGLRFREPVYKTIRELALSYFEFFFNLKAEKTLRRYSRVIDLSRFDDLGWMETSKGVDRVEKYLKTLKGYPLFTQKQAGMFSKVDERSFQSGTLGINRAGAYQFPSSTRED